MAKNLAIARNMDREEEEEEEDNQMEDTSLAEEVYSEGMVRWTQINR